MTGVKQCDVTYGEFLGPRTQRGWLVAGRSRVPVIVSYDVPAGATTAGWDEYDWADHYVGVEIDPVQTRLDGIADAEVAACVAFFDHPMRRDRR